MLTIGCLICAVLFGCCCGYIFWYFYSERENSKIYEELQEEAEVSPTPVSSEETPPEHPADTEPEESGDLCMDQNRRDEYRLSDRAEFHGRHLLSEPYG